MELIPKKLYIWTLVRSDLQSDRTYFVYNHSKQYQIRIEKCTTLQNLRKSAKTFLTLRKS